KVTIITGLTTGVISFTLFVFAKNIIMFVAGADYVESVSVLMILSAHPFLIALSNIFGIQTMLSFGKDKAFQNILLTASILNLFLSLILVPYFRHIGSAISVTIVELFVTSSTLIYLQLSGIKIIRI
ncbi:MAG: flippase, partial [Candidatus Methanomethylicia archaeon]|nr:flippase [Candidatus Methanomethylicia archaeon]